jgi:hypothetical protein
MKEYNGKREIEAVCDTFQGGLIGYLSWKISESLTIDTPNAQGIQLEDFEDIQDFKNIYCDISAINHLDEANFISEMDNIDEIWC